MSWKVSVTQTGTAFNDTSLTSFASQFGRVVDVQVDSVEGTAGCRGVVTYQHREAMESALRASSVAMINGHRVQLEPYPSRTVAKPLLRYVAVALSCPSTHLEAARTCLKCVGEACGQVGAVEVFERRSGGPSVVGIVQFTCHDGVNKFLDGVNRCSFDRVKANVSCFEHPDGATLSDVDLHQFPTGNFDADHPVMCLVSDVPAWCSEEYLMTRFSEYATVEAFVVRQFGKQGHGLLRFQKWKSGLEVLLNEGCSISGQLVTAVRIETGSERSLSASMQSLNLPVSFDIGRSNSGSSSFVSARSKSVASNGRVHNTPFSDSEISRMTRNSITSSMRLGINHSGVFNMVQSIGTVHMSERRSPPDSSSFMRSANYAQYCSESGQAVFVFGHSLSTVLLAVCNGHQWVTFSLLFVTDATCCFCLVSAWFGSCPYIWLCVDHQSARYGSRNPSILTDIFPGMVLSVLNVLCMILLIVQQFNMVSVVSTEGSKSTEGRKFQLSFATFIAILSITFCRGLLCKSRRDQTDFIVTSCIASFPTVFLNSKLSDTRTCHVEQWFVLVCITVHGVRMMLLYVRDVVVVHRMLHRIETIVVPWVYFQFFIICYVVGNQLICGCRFCSGGQVGFFGTASQYSSGIGVAILAVVRGFLVSHQRAQDEAAQRLDCSIDRKSVV